MRETHHCTAQLVAAAVEELDQSVGPELLRCASSDLDRSMRITIVYRWVTLGWKSGQHPACIES